MSWVHDRAMNQSPEPAAENVPPELIHEMRALLAEFGDLDPSTDGYDEAVAALQAARDAVAAAVASCDPAYVAAHQEGAGA